MTNVSFNGLFVQDGLIDGTWTQAASAKTLDVTNPATQAVIGTVPDMGRTETKAAIEGGKPRFRPLEKEDPCRARNPSRSLAQADD